MRRDLVRMLLLTAAAASATAAVVHRLRSSSGADAALERAKSSLARADVEAARAASRVAAVESQAKVAVQNALNAERVSRAHWQRVRIAGASSLSVQLTPGGASTLVAIPAPVVDRLRADSAAVVSLGAAMGWQDSIIVAQRQQIASDSVARTSAGAVIRALDHERRARCGWKCGVVIGVVGLVVLGRAAGG